MSFWNRLFGSSAAARAPLDDYWFAQASRMSEAGERVTIDDALSLPVVSACVSVLSDAIRALPFAVVERQTDGARRETSNHPLAEVLEAPNAEQDGAELFAQAVWDLATEGDAFIEILQGRRGFVDELRRLDPCHVHVDRTPFGRRYRIYEPGAPVRLLEDAYVWHMRRPPIRDGLRGTSPIHFGREAIGKALAVDRYSARFFRNDATPSAVIEHPGNFESLEDKKRWLDAFTRWVGGKNRHRPAILEYGMKLSKLGVTPNEAQMLETTKAAYLNVARLWRMPAHKIGLEATNALSGREEQSIAFVTDTLLPWVTLIEGSIKRQLIRNPRRFSFEFNAAGLLRGNLQARYAAYAVGRNWGWLSVNEIRELEGRAPIDGGNVHLQPLNMQPVGGEMSAPATNPSVAPIAPDASDETAAAIAYLHRSVGADREVARLATLLELPHAA